VQQASRHDLARALAPRSVHASRREKGQFLDEFCALTGYTRKHALVLLRHPRITRRYDTAQAPYRRLVASGCLSKKAARRLTVRSKALDPLRLKLELESAQRTLAERAVRPAIVHPLRILY
jgi:hypothetical protein